MSADSRGRRPNLVMFVPDQWRGGEAGCLGNPVIRTPHLDALAREGVAFSYAFTQNPVCTPSRCSFMTGWYPHVRGHRDMHHMLSPEEPCLLKELKEAGYYVFWAGKNDLLRVEDLPNAYSYHHKPEPGLTPHGRNPWRLGDRLYHSFLYGRLPDGHRTPDDSHCDAAARFLRDGPPEPSFGLFHAAGGFAELTGDSDWRRRVIEAARLGTRAKNRDTYLYCFAVASRLGAGAEFEPVIKEVLGALAQRFTNSLAELPPERWPGHGGPRVAPSRANIGRDIPYAVGALVRFPSPGPWPRRRANPAPIPARAPEDWYQPAGQPGPQDVPPKPQELLSLESSGPAGDLRAGPADWSVRDGGVTQVTVKGRKVLGGPVEPFAALVRLKDDPRLVSEYRRLPAVVERSGGVAGGPAVVADLEPGYLEVQFHGAWAEPVPAAEAEAGLAGAVDVIFHPGWRPPLGKPELTRAQFRRFLADLDFGENYGLFALRFAFSDTHKVSGPKSRWVEKFVASGLEPRKFLYSMYPDQLKEFCRRIGVRYDPKDQEGTVRAVIAHYAR